VTAVYEGLNICQMYIESICAFFLYLSFFNSARRRERDGWFVVVLGMTVSVCGWGVNCGVIIAVSFLCTVQVMYV
jgi:hypothetical protein